MNKNEIVIALGTAHRLREPGKRSTDGRLVECVYSRETVREVRDILQDMGYKVLIDYEPLDLPKSMQSPSVTQERQRELAMRVNFVNELCRQNGKDRVIYVSFHVNAAGADGQWHDARGWCVYTSPGRTKADDLATCLWNAADRNLPHDHKSALRADWSDGDPDYEAKLYVLTKTQFPAVLTESLFQDNRADVDYLLSEEGRHAIVRLHVEGIIKYIESASLGDFPWRLRIY